MEDVLPHRLLRADSSGSPDQNPLLLFRIQNAFAENYDPVWSRNAYVFSYGDNIAISSKAALGIFQIGSMIDLAIHVKLSAEQLNLERATTQKNWTKSLVCVVSLPLIPLRLLRGKIRADLIFAQEKVTEGKRFFYNNFTPTIFSVLSIGLTVACICLMVRMNKYFPRSLKDEACRIKTIFLVFTFSYLTRATVFFVLPRLDLSYLAENLTLYIGFNFWDVIPLTLIMVYHYKCFPTGSSDDEES